MMSRFRLPLGSIVLLPLLAACGTTTSNAPAPTVFSPPVQPTSSAIATVAPAPTSGTASSTALPAAGGGQGASSLANLRIEVQELAPTFDQPLYLTHAGDSSGRMFVVEKLGQIIIVQNDQRLEPPFLDIRDRVGAQSSEQGLLSVAFDPKYPTNGRLFVNYTNRNGDTVISRFQAQSDQADPASEVILLTIDQPYANHNGGLIKFGPDGYLYVGMGDGGSAGDPQNHAQNGQSLLGKMLRLDVSGDKYSIPADNPFANGQNALPEIWATGLRNPWRFSFDRSNGNLFIADVGQNQYEEINMQPANAAGVNYGWKIMESRHCYRESTCDSANLVQPIAEYDHAFGCSVTGGYVYRGADFPTMTGIYLFGDYCTGRIWGLQETSDGAWQQQELLQTDINLSSFGENEAGELFVTDLGSGKISRIVIP